MKELIIETYGNEKYRSPKNNGTRTIAKVIKNLLLNFSKYLIEQYTTGIKTIWE